MQLLHIGTRSMRRNGTGVSVTCCGHCGQRTQTDPADYHAIASEECEPAALMQRTNPRLPLRAAGRVLWDRSASAGQLPPPERVVAIREPVLALAYLLPKRVQIEVPWQTVPIFIATFSGALALMLGFWIDLTGRSGGEDGLVMVIALAVATLVSGLAVALINGRKDRARYLREFEPKLARALRPLRPALQEIKDLSAWATAAQHPVSRFLDPERLHRVICSRTDESLSNADSMGLLELADAMHRELMQNSEPGDESEPAAA